MYNKDEVFDNDEVMAFGNYERIIAKNILQNTLTATGWALTLLFEIGEITVQSFLSPSIYADFPHRENIFSTEKFKKNKKAAFKEITIRQSLRRLEKYGFVERKDSKISLTVKGRFFLNEVLKKKKAQEKPWDRKYRVVIFDVPESKRDIRNWLRGQLYLLGYKKLQQSVFIGKKPLTEIVIKEIKKKKIGNCVNYLLVDKVYKNVLK